MNEREAFEQWWSEFAATHDEWRFADSGALRFQAWQTACAWQRKRDAQICDSLGEGNFVPTDANRGFVGGTKTCAQAIREQEKMK